VRGRKRQGVDKPPGTGKAVRMCKACHTKHSKQDPCRITPKREEDNGEGRSTAA
jgi:hypothetical protein